MARGKVKIGNRSLRKAVATYGDIVIDEMKDIVVSTAQLIQSTAKTLAQYDTGNLRDSIEMEILNDGMLAIVRVTAEYAVYVEFGTGIYATGPGGSNAKTIPWAYPHPDGKRDENGDLIFIWTSGMKPQPYWEPAIDAGQRHFRSRMRRLGK